MCETQAPWATKVSADAVCFGSSLATRRTRTFVSTASMTICDGGANALPELGQRLTRGRARREQRAVEIFGRVLSGAPNGDVIAASFPFQRGARPNAKFAPNL